MDRTGKFVLPAPNFGGNGLENTKAKTHFLTPSGMTLLPRNKQPPPMYGPRGATLPPKFLRQQHYVANEQKQQPHHHHQPQKQQPAEIWPNAAPVERQYCEACEMEFDTERDMQRHRSQHEPCPVDGCKFRGHPKVMDNHVITLHNDGLFEQLRKLSTPEEIAAWREERRKKYPTVANTKMRELARQQREKRGERLLKNQNRFGRAEDRRRINNSEPNREQQSRERKPRNEQQRYKPNHEKQIRETRKREFPAKSMSEQRSKPTDTAKAEVSATEIQMFKGTGYMKDYKHSAFPKKINKNALASLLMAYGSDSEASDSNCSEESETEELQQPKEINSDSTKVNAAVEHGKAEAQEYDVKNKDEAALPKVDSTHKMEHSKALEVETNECQKEIEIVSEAKVSVEKGSAHAIVPAKAADEKNIITTTVNTQVASPRINSNASLPSTSEQTVAATSDDDGPEEAPIAHTSDAVTAPAISTSAVVNDTPAKENPRTSMRERLQRKRKSGLDYSKARLRKQNTMLEKLLETEIRHERNVLLQCVRFVCENNFFGIGQAQVKKN